VEAGLIARGQPGDLSEPNHREGNFLRISHAMRWSTNVLRK